MNFAREKSEGQLVKEKKMIAEQKDIISNLKKEHDICEPTLKATLKATEDK